uniref:DUF6496 domain-containing protein n=1 Tax=Pedobacter schmidteae TaxID=2201271 RepID=UPI0013CE7ED0|nr:DUF6496 domain-containing protein [Pedobacter schmidteae]
MAKYSEKASEKVEKTMHEMKEGKLKSGSGNKYPYANIDEERLFGSISRMLFWYVIFYN